MRRFAIAALLAATSITPANAADILIHGGPIHTGVDAAPTAEAVLIRDDKILFVGHDRDNAILVITADKYEWTFQDFFESFGVKWYTESGKDTEKQYLIYSPAISDEWELV